MKMTTSETQNHWIAIIVAILVHIALFLVPTYRKVISTESSKISYEVPINFEMQTTIEDQAPPETNSITEEPETGFKSEQNTQTTPQNTTPMKQESLPQKTLPLKSGVQLTTEKQPPQPVSPQTSVPTTEKSSAVFQESKSLPARLPGDRDAPETSAIVSPITPKEAIANEWKGKIIVDATVGTEGTITEYKIIQSSGYKKLDELFIKSILEGKFKPRRIMGNNEPGKIRLEHEFK